MTESLHRSLPSVLVCRGCCCGTERKHPDVDHDAQLDALRSVVRTRVVDCVDECSQSNVVIVRPGDSSSIWLGGVLAASETQVLCAWLAQGAPLPLPIALQQRVFVRNGSSDVCAVADVDEAIDMTVSTGVPVVLTNKAASL
jgi:hypothetical protein